MSRNILVLGGTRFFGEKLVQQLIDKGHDVTILTRGKSAHSFGTQVKQIIADRTNKKEFIKALQGLTFDVVYDNICYSPNDAKILCEIFNGRIGKLIFTSTLSTYEIDGEMKKEEDFDPYNYPIQYGGLNDFTYGEGKRLAEAVFFKEATFPVVAVRFPIVMGTDDYTERLHFYVRKVLTEQPIVMQNLAAEMGFILAEEAAAFLVWAGESSAEGPFNACATGEISLKELFQLIEEAANKKAIVSEGETEERTPYDIGQSWFMTNKKATLAGFEFTQLNSWLPQLVEEIVKLEKH